MSKKVISLRSSDEEIFEIEEAIIAQQSETLKHMIDDDCTDGFIPLPNVNSKILAKVIEYCKKHYSEDDNNNKNVNEEVKKWDAEFVKVDDDDNNNKNVNEEEEDVKKWDAEFVKVDDATLMELILAANYLAIKNLMDLTCQTVADMIKDKSVEDVRAFFNIENDYTPEEEDEIRKKNAWAFE